MLEAVLNVMYVEHTLIPDCENGLRTPVLVPSSEKSVHLTSGFIDSINVYNMLVWN